MILKTFKEFINEDGYATVGNTPGIGAVVLPIINGADGSGDIGIDGKPKKKKKKEEKTNEGKNTAPYQITYQQAKIQYILSKIDYLRSKNSDQNINIKTKEGINDMINSLMDQLRTSKDKLNNLKKH